MKNRTGQEAVMSRSYNDTLYKPAHVKYFDDKIFSDVKLKLGVEPAKVLARQVALFNAKEHQWNRRTYTRDYCNRSECGSYAYMNNDMFTGRMETVWHNKWRVGDPWDDTVEVLTIRIPYRGDVNTEDEEDIGSFLAAIRTVDCDGLTVDVSEVYESRGDAERAADTMAERECAVISEHNEKYQIEVRTEEISEELIELRRGVLTLIRKIKPIRCDIPSAIVMCVMDKITDMLTQRSALFIERGELS